MTEQPVQFGPERTLVGVLTRPDAPASDLAVLLFNAGVIPRVGSHRFNVKLARRLAAIGQHCLRFDLSGQGDSRAATAQGDFIAQAIHDLRAAMDHLEQTEGLRRFVLVGFCSGAVNAFHAAQADARVAGVYMFDGYWYRTHWTLPLRHWQRFRSLGMRQVFEALGRRLVRLVGRPPEEAAQRDALAGEEGSANPPREVFCRALQGLVDRGVSVYLAYTGSVLEYYSYAGQFRQAFKDQAFVDRVRCDFMPHIDHTLVTLDSQRELAARLTDWVRAIAAGKAD